MLQNLIFVIVGAALVLVGADKLTDGSVGLARRFGIPELVIGLTVVAFGTSLPEFIVSLVASINGSPAMAVGNIVGSNLFNTLMIVGCTALVCPIVVSRSTVGKDIPFSLLASIVIGALALDSVFGTPTGRVNVLDRADGICLLCFFVIFMKYSLGMARGGGKSEGDEQSGPQLGSARIAVYIVAGLGGLIGGGELFVEGATGIAQALGVSDAVIGLTLVAGGTSLPELATSIIAARKGQSALAIGNVVGSNLFNVFWILGVCATISPLPVAGLAWTDFALLAASSLLFLLFARTSLRIARWEGFVMAVAFVAYIAYLVSGL